MSVHTASTSQGRTSFGWVTTGQKGRNKKAKKKYSGWWCANCGEPYAWRGVNGIVIMQAGSTEEDQKIICAQGHPQGEVENVTAALRIVTKLQDTEGKQHFEVLSHGCGERFAESWRKFVSVDNARTIMKLEAQKTRCGGAQSVATKHRALKVNLCGQEKRGSKASNGMVCCCQQVSMHEVWKRHQVHEDAREMPRAEILCQQIRINGEWGILGATVWSEEWTGREKFGPGCRKSSGCARQRMGPKLMNCCKREQVGTKEYGKMLKRVRVLEEGRIPAKEARKLED